MATVISNLLKENKLSIYDVAKISGVPKSTLANSIKKPIESWSIRVLNAFAEGLRKQPSQLLDILQPSNYILKINDKEQTIQGVYISDKETYQQIKFVVQMEHLEGWNPTSDDIKYLLHNANHPDPEIDDQLDDIFGDQLDAR